MKETLETALSRSLQSLPYKPPFQALLHPSPSPHFSPVLSTILLSILTLMNKSKKYSWPTTPLKPSKKEKKLKSLLKKLDKAAANNEGLSKEIQDLKSDIIDLTNLE